MCMQYYCTYTIIICSIYLLYYRAVGSYFGLHLARHSVLASVEEFCMAKKVKGVATPGLKTTELAAFRCPFNSFSCVESLDA